MISNKWKTFLFCLIAFLGQFLRMSLLTIGKKIHATPEVLFAMGLIAFIDVCLYLVVIIPWVKLPENYNFIYRLGITFVICVAVVAFMSIINVYIGDWMIYHDPYGNFMYAWKGNLYGHIPMMLVFGYLVASWQKAELGKAVAENEKAVAEREKVIVELEKAKVEEEKSG